MIQDFGGYRLPLVTRILSQGGYRLPLVTRILSQFGYRLPLVTRILAADWLPVTTGYQI